MNSITSGLIEFDIDLEIQNLSKVNKVLCDLGYSPNTKWWELSNINSSTVCNKLIIQKMKLIK